MKNSNSTGILVLILGVVAIVLSYVFGFTAYNNKNSELQAEIDELEARRDELKEDYAHKDEYLKKTDEFDKEYEKTLKKFDTGITNEGELMDLYNLQGTTGIMLDLATFTMPEETYAFDGSLTTSDMVAPTVDANGNTVEADPIITSTAVNSSYRGVSADVNFTMSGTYANIKAALNSLADESKRRAFKSFNFTCDTSKDTVTCNGTYKEYAITGDDRKQTKVDIPESASGRTDLFLGGLGVQVTTE